MKNKIKKLLKKEFSKRTITIIIGVSCAIFIIWALWITSMVFGQPYTLKYYQSRNEHYQGLVEEFSNDTEVLKVVEKCQDNLTKIKCAFDSTPFEWTERSDNFSTLSPTELIRRNGEGYCRDISVFRKAVLDRLDISSKFKILPKHIYVIAYEGDFVYKLDNSKLRKSLINKYF